MLYYMHYSERWTGTCKDRTIPRAGIAGNSRNRSYKEIDGKSVNEGQGIAVTYTIPWRQPITLGKNKYSKKHITDPEDIGSIYLSNVYTEKIENVEDYKELLVELPEDTAIF